MYGKLLTKVNNESSESQRSYNVPGGDDGLLACDGDVQAQQVGDLDSSNAWDDGGFVIVTKVLVDDIYTLPIFLGRVILGGDGIYDVLHPGICFSKHLFREEGISKTCACKP